MNSGFFPAIVDGARHSLLQSGAPHGPRDPTCRLAWRWRTARQTSRLQDW